MFEAARVGDKIVHTSALAGFIAGAIVGLALVAAASFVICTGGAGAFILGMAMTVAGGVLPSIGEAIGKRLGRKKTGVIITGSKIVHTNKREAAYTGTIEGNPEGMQTAKGSEVNCSKHPSTPLPQVAEGSTLVFLDSRPAARYDDRTECGAYIDEGSDNVHMGKDKYEYLPVQDEVPPWLRKLVDVAMFVAGFASGIWNIAKMGLTRAVLPCIGKLALNMAASWAIGKGIEHYGGKAINYFMGHPVDATTGRKVLKPEDEIDFVLPGYMPIVWSRFYASDLHYESMLGKGWMLPYEQYLYQENNILYHVDNQGRILPFENIEERQKVYLADEQIFLIRTEGGHYAIQTLDDQFYYFGEVLDNGEKAYLQRIEDRFGHYIHFTYDNDQLTDITATGGIRLHLHYRHPQGKVTEIVRIIDNQAVETMVQYRYNHDGQLIAVINRNGDTTRLFDYQDGLMVQHQNGLGFSCHYRWQTIDNQPRVIEHWTSDGEHYHFNYDLKNRSTRVTDALNRQSEVRYDERYQMTYCQDFGGDVYQLEYDDTGNLITYILPNDNKISLKYDELSRLIEETDPLGKKIAYAYHQATNLQTKITFPDNSCWQAEYDDKGCIISQTDQLGNTTYYYPTEDGVPYAIVDALENRNTIVWNELGQVQRYTDCSNKVTEYQYDDNLHLTSRTNAMGEKIRLLRKPQGEVTHIIHADGSQESFTYNAMGQLLSHTNGKGQTVDLSRNPRGLLIKRFDPKDQTIIYQYDVAQRLTSLLNENNEAYRFSYDDSDRLTEEVSIDGISKRYSYNPDGYLTVITEMGIDQHLKPTERTTFLERNQAGLLLAKTTEDATYYYQYNQAEQLTQIERKPTAKGKILGIIEDKINFSYDLKGRLLQEENLQGNLTYLYDALDNLTSLTLPDGKQLIHQYYGSGHLHRISLDRFIISDFERDDLHREILRTQGNLTSRFGYDAQGRKHWQYASHSPLAELTTLNKQQLPIDRQLKSRDNALFRQYQYDPAGELSVLLDKARGKTQYSYAENGQLQQVTTQNGQEHFTSDAAGNFLPSQVLPNQRFALHNRITDYGNIHLTYDPWGNVIEKAIGLNNYQTFSYDCENRLIKAQVYSHDKLITESHYYYDSLGRRIKKQIDNLQTHQKKQTTFLWQGLRLLEEQTEQLKQLYLYEPHSYAPLARLDTMSNGTTEIYYYHTDQIGTPLELTNQQGTIVWQANYKAWGEIESCRINEVEQNLRYQGQYFDQETELHYNTFRYYDPQVGRFTTQDPIGLEGGFNLYIYALNPIVWIDPWGWCGGTTKPINLPSHKKVTIDIDHILDRHTVGGLTASKRAVTSLFPENMTPKQIQNAVKEAYRNSSRIATQGERILLQGTSGRMKIEMWLNTTTKTIETAYPKGII